MTESQKDKALRLMIENNMRQMCRFSVQTEVRNPGVKNEHPSHSQIRLLPTAYTTGDISQLINSVTDDDFDIAVYLSQYEGGSLLFF